MANLSSCVEIPPRRLKLILTPDLVNPESLRLDMNSSGVFGKMPSRAT